MSRRPSFSLPLSAGRTLVVTATIDASGWRDPTITRHLYDPETATSRSEEVTRAALAPDEEEAMCEALGAACAGEAGRLEVCDAEE